MRSSLQLLLALLTLAVLGWAVAQGYALLRAEQLRLDARTQALVALAALVFIAGMFVLGSAIRRNSQAAVQTQLLPRKVQLYEDFLLGWQAVRAATDFAQEAALETKLAKIRTCLALHASRAVLVALNDLTDTAAAGGPVPATQAAFEALLLAMRADLGQPSHLPLKKAVPQSSVLT